MGEKNVLETVTSCKCQLMSILGLVVAFYFYRKIIGHRSKIFVSQNFDRIPGPTGIPIFGNLFDLVRPGCDPFKVVIHWFQKYGNTFKCTLFYYKFCAIFDPVHIQKLLTSNDPAHLNKPRGLYGMIGNGDLMEGIIMSDYSSWKPHRKVINRLFTYNGIQHQVSVMNKGVKNLVKDFQSLGSESRKSAEEYTHAQIGKLIDNMALDNSLNIIMDSKTVSATDRQKFRENYLTAKSGASLRVQQPWLLLNFVWRFHPRKSKVDRAISEMRKILYDVAARYRQIKGKILDSQNTSDDDLGIKTPFKCIIEEMVESGFSDEEIYNEAVTVIGAGHETTSWSIRFLLFRLALNPDIQEKCRQEVDELFLDKLKSTSEETSPSSFSIDLTMNDLHGLEYLDRCVRENLRLAPIVPIFARRLDKPLKLKENLVLDTDVTLTISPWVLHRNPTVYLEPEKFDPDRFLPEECAKRHPYAYLPFSGGSRNCIGLKVAPLSAKLVTAFLLRYFKIETTDRWETLEFVFDISLTTRNPIHLSFQRRSGTL